MLQFILKRLGLALLVAFTVSFISFSLLFLSGDPAAALAGETASGEDVEALRRLYGFDRPMLVQYGEWLFSALQGDFGESYYFRLPVASLIADRLSVTMTLGVCGITFALLTAVPLGVVEEFERTVHVVCAEHDVDMARTIHVRVAVFLGETAADGDLHVGVLFFQHLEVTEGPVELVVGILTDAAGVEDDHVGIGDVVDAVHPVGLE